MARQGSERPSHELGGRAQPLLALVTILVGGPVLLGALLPNRASASFPGRNGPIVFSRALTGGHQPYGVFTIGANSSAVRRVVFGSAPQVSADGTAIAFVPNDAARIERANADGSGAHRVPNTSGGGDPAFSPAGNQILFARTSVTDPHPGVFEVNLDGSKSKRLSPQKEPSSGQSFYQDPVFAPDGQTIAFSRYTVPSDCQPNAQGSFICRPRKPRPSSVYLMAADGSGLHQLALGRLPDFSPDGRRIVFDRSGSIFVMSTSGSGLRRLTNHAGRFPADRDATFSPDGTTIAFVRSTKTSNDLYMMRADGSRVHRLTSPEFVLGDGDPAWGPPPG